MDEFLLAQKGNEKALARLVRKHAPLVQALAKRFEQTQDAFQAGCIGLLQAIRGYKPGLGFAFSSYAVPKILGEMRRTRETNFSWRQEKRLLAAQRFRNEMMLQLGREPTVTEMAEKVGVNACEMAMLLERRRTVYYDDENRHLPLADPESEKWQERFFIRDILARMPGEYSFLLRQRYICRESQASLAEKMSMNQSSISRAEKKARLMFISAWQG